MITIPLPKPISPISAVGGACIRYLKLGKPLYFKIYSPIDFKVDTLHIHTIGIVFRLKNNKLVYDLCVFENYNVSEKDFLYYSKTILEYKKKKFVNHLIQRLVGI